MNRALRCGALAASLALCLAGIGTVTNGVAVPVKASVAQNSLDRVFEQRLADNAPTPRHPRKGGGPSADVAHEPRVGRWTPTFAGMTKVASHDQVPEFAPLPTTGPIARLSVARLGVKEIVLAGGASHEQLAKGPAIVKQADAASPVTILAAHRDTHFLFIRDLRAGDEVALRYVNGETARYRVTRFETVRWDNFAYPLDPARPLLALATCYPFGGTEYGGPWRRVAWAERIA